MYLSTRRVETLISAVLAFNGLENSNKISHGSDTIGEEWWNLCNTNMYYLSKSSVKHIYKLFFFSLDLFT